MKRENNRVHKLVRKNRRRKSVKAVQSAVVIVLVLLCVSFAGLKFSAININAKGSETGGYDKMYKSVMVEQNECLWDIADRYMGVGYSDKRAYVDEIRRLNKLSGDDIHYGEYICIPYYQ